MSQWLTQRNEFYRVMVTQGITRLDEVEAAFPLGYNVPQAKIEKWFSRLLKTPKEFSSQRRYVNRFKIGADPEFVFQGETKVPSDEDSRATVSRLIRVDAQALKLFQGPAFGADNNGRLAEIRPHPSRSAVSVVASILSTLRWLAILYPQTLKLQWVSGAYLYDDGIGGHVHFGRKRPNRQQEITALDSIEELLVGLNMFPMAEIRRRRQGDAHGNAPYGQLGDYRLQTHGYEYRTWPSWLDSPELAFITLVLSKLAVHNPELLKYRQAKDGNQRIQQVLNLLAYYKDTDDDARLALLMVKRRLPRHQGGDFKSRWGLGKVPEIKMNVEVLPLSIPSDLKSDLEVFQSLYLDFPLEFKVPDPTWAPLVPPKGYEMVIKYANTIHQKGLGELIWDICCSKEYPISFLGVGPAHSLGAGLIIIPRKMWLALPTKERQQHWIEPYSEKSTNNAIMLTSTLRENPRLALKAKNWLLQGLLPLWKVSSVQEDSFQQWKKHVQVTPKEPKFLGKILFSDNPQHKEKK